MRILIDHHSPFILAHGGFQIQIEQTYLALKNIGEDVELLRWWDDKQAPDLIHFFGKASAGYLQRAKSKGIATVVSELHTGLGSHTSIKKFIQSKVINFAKRFTKPVAARLGWNSYEFSDAIIALTPYEASLMASIFHADRKRIHVVPNGVDDIFLEHREVSREEWLLCTATITERKRVLELAKAAVLADVKVKILGRPYSESDPYFIAFRDFVQKSGRLVEWHGEVSDRSVLADHYRRAKAFILPSTMESLSLSALEAAACQCPLILTNLPWARTTFGSSATYLPDTSNPAGLADGIRSALSQPPSSHPFKVFSWLDVAGQLSAIYRTLT